MFFACCRTMMGALWHSHRHARVLRTYTFGQRLRIIEWMRIYRCGSYNKPTNFDEQAERVSIGRCGVHVNGKNPGGKRTTTTKNEEREKRNGRRHTNTRVVRSVRAINIRRVVCYCWRWYGCSSDCRACFSAFFSLLLSLCAQCPTVTHAHNYSVLLTH